MLEALPQGLTSDVFFDPDPDLGARPQAHGAGPRAGAERELTAPDLVEMLFESEPVRIALMAVPALNLFGDLLEPGQGALTWLWLLLLRSCVAPAGNGSLVGALERLFVDARGVLLRNEPVLAIGGGGVVETAARELRAATVVISEHG